MNAVAKEILSLCYQGITVEIRLWNKYTDMFQIIMSYKDKHTYQAVPAEMLSTDDQIVRVLEYIKDALMAYCGENNENK